MNFPVMLSSMMLITVLGCSKPEVVVDYREVKVPVLYQLERPNRPVWEKNDTVVAYLVRVLGYTKQLENIIDESRRSK